MLFGLSSPLFAQKKLPVIKATQENAFILDGDQVKVNWTLEPGLKPDIYYVNIPLKGSKVTLQTDQDKISFKTKYGQIYDLIVLLRETDSCLVRIVAREAPTPVSMQLNKTYPQSIPFTLIGSRIYFQGYLNGQKNVTIQFDLGAGASCVNRSASEKLALTFDGKAMVDNTQGVNEARVSSGNTLTLGDFSWSGVPLIEVGNMKPHEDLIIGNGLFRNKIIEIDYDKKLLTVHDQLPAYAKEYKKQAVFYEQDRPKFKADFVQNGKKYAFWFLFDTGRDGTMLLGEDFTSQGSNWANLKELQILNGRKIIRLDATIAGVEFKDIVTNAADPSNPQGRTTLFGNQVLNHFNVILDNRNGLLYLKPNSRKDEPYSDYESYLKQMAK
ncbi:hypothetical protein GCM10027275_20010 [Rhabdobacter roseus]|uniref:Aspartyl protease n=1 Tax=Rhabdobacter roseus TaxID=1655419 RepID=A0A840TKD9_9BACT|nr:retropepsin-like aspartic protease [Rhabdobacter roseus]MBB5283931.1 hypothetical protein [Rhabdobacter roseus]